MQRARHISNGFAFTKTIHMSISEISDEGECGEHRSCDVQCCMIDTFYNDIISSIHTAALHTIVRITSNSQKPYWNDELDRLKQTAIARYEIWVAAGKPQSGQLFH